MVDWPPDRQVIEESRQHLGLFQTEDVMIKCYGQMLRSYVYDHMISVG